jgi:site-specific DNA-cytosine methylase
VPTCLPARLVTRLVACLLARLPACLPACLSVCPPACLPALLVAQLESLGYKTHYKLLSSRNVIPQDRLRLYIVGFRDPAKHAAFKWPARLLCKFEDAVPTPPCVREVLEVDVGEEYTINEHQVPHLHTEKSALFSISNRKTIICQDMLGTDAEKHRGRRSVFARAVDEAAGTRGCEAR